MIPIVTATDANFLQGTIALHNSYLKNSSDGFSFHVMSYGNDTVRDALEDRGISVIHNYKLCDDLPTSWRFTDQMPAMYARIYVPEIFKDRYSIYLDADCIILKNLYGLIGNYGNSPIAAMPFNCPPAKQIGGYSGPEFKTFIASCLIFDRRNWIKKSIFDRCLKLMSDSDYVFHTVSQSVLLMAVKDDWHNLGESAQVQGGHATTTKQKIDNAYILHFAGTNPWDEFPQHLKPVPSHKKHTRSIWRGYA